MRLSHFEQQSITATIKESLRDVSPAELRLYGSRVDDTLKGGDIDLLLILESDEHLTRVQQKKFAMLAQLMAVLGERKIDLTVTSREQLQQDPFLKLIWPTSKRLF